MNARSAFAACLFLLASAAHAACEKPHVPAFDDATYYQPAQGLAGPALKTALNGIIRGHTRHTYSCIWTILKEADEDPANSSNVIELYTQRSVPKADQDTGVNNPDAWNREHVWAKSHGFPNQSQFAYTDAHHLRAADRSVNTERSNDDFADGGSPVDDCADCKEGDGTWEPPDVVKGDVARMMFYMAVRYEGGDNSNTPDLELVDHTTSNGEPRFGKLCTLLRWHQADPVSDREKARNDVVYAWQGNRNPFIDHPTWVASIWGKECGQAAPTKQQLLDKLEELQSKINELRQLIESAE